jgi:hypothetical protein
MLLAQDIAREREIPHATACSRILQQSPRRTRVIGLTPARADGYARGSKGSGLKAQGSGENIQSSVGRL